MHFLCLSVAHIFSVALTLLACCAQVEVLKQQNAAKQLELEQSQQQEVGARNQLAALSQTLEDEMSKLLSQVKRQEQDNSELQTTNAHQATALQAMESKLQVRVHVEYIHSFLC